MLSYLSIFSNFRANKVLLYGVYWYSVAVTILTDKTFISDDY